MKTCRNLLIMLIVSVMLFTGCNQKKKVDSSTTNEEVKQIALESFLKNDDEKNCDTAKEIIAEAEKTNAVKNADEVKNTETADASDKTEVVYSENTGDSNVVSVNFDASKPMLMGTNDGNLIPEAGSTFETANSVKDSGWTSVYGSPSKVEITNSDFGKCLHFTKISGSAASYHTAGINLANYITAKGRYTIEFDFKTNLDVEIRPFELVVRCDKEYGFTTVVSSPTSTYYSGGDVPIVKPGQWGTAKFDITVSATDIDTKKTWDFCLHKIADNVTDVYIDNFKVISESFNDKEQTQVTSAETYVANEITLLAECDYKDAFNDVDVDLVLTNGETTYTIPCFWDGGYTWKARFYCPTPGTWAYKTVCTNTADKGLHNVRCAFVCNEYSGDLDVYKHGLVDVKEGNKYFTYADGTPFFYLGDTHWSLGAETYDLITDLCAKRTEQRFTVIQSEPIGATFKFENGINESDISGLRIYDQKFKIIAESGLTHVNASFFYPSGMHALILNFGGYSDKPMGSASHTGEDKKTTSVTTYDLSTNAKTYLQKICRYWAARYSAYPVMWSLGQEVDNDFFWDRGTFNSHEGWNFVNNPYKLVADYLHQFDAYKHPLTAHQEGLSNLGNNAANSSFKDVVGHNWYATQWSPAFTGMPDKNAPGSFYATSKPTVLYEGRYCYLWTKNYGARVQGWAAFLNGMCGYGWGGQDTWSYTNTYSENADTSDGLDTVRAMEKQFATYYDSFEYKSAYQVGYMRSFFEDKVGEWQDLIPWFAMSAQVIGNTRAVNYSAALPDYSKVVVYFYNTDTRAKLDPAGATSYHPLDENKEYPYYNSSFPEKSNVSTANPKYTGAIKGLPNGTYNLTWFNPVTNEYSAGGKIVVTNQTDNVSFPNKTVGQDMIILLERAE